MAGPTIARNYSDVASLIKAHQNSILEVNADGSIRSQNLKEKIGTLGLRILGKYNANKAEKDAKVAVAIQNLFLKTGQNENSYFAPKNHREFDRFFHPQPLHKRSATKEIKGKSGGVLLQAISNQQAGSQKVPAQKLLFSALADVFTKLGSTPEFRQDSEALEGLSTVYRAASRNLRADNADATLAQLQEDLKGVGLQLGKGRLEDFDISRGVEVWAKENAPGELDRYS